MGVELLAELAEERRLPDAGLAAQQDQAALRRRAHGSERRGELGECPVALEERVVSDHCASHHGGI